MFALSKNYEFSLIGIPVDVNVHVYMSRRLIVLDLQCMHVVFWPGSMLIAMAESSKLLSEADPRGNGSNYQISKFFPQSPNYSSNQLLHYFVGLLIM